VIIDQRPASKILPTVAAKQIPNKTFFYGRVLNRTAPLRLYLRFLDGFACMDPAIACTYLDQPDMPIHDYQRVKVNLLVKGNA